MRKNRVFVADFETTVYKGQERTDVWAAALVELGTEAVTVDHSIAEFWDRVLNLKQSVIIYFHNLKFDGAFLLSYFLGVKKYEQAFLSTNVEGTTGIFYDKKGMWNNSFAYSISDKGQWYTITVKVNDKIIEIRDSLKLLPFSVKRIGQSFGTKHKKLDMEYTGFRFPGCEITPEEMSYIKNDVLVIKEALEIMYGEGHNKLTIGACCLKEFNTKYPKKELNERFPNVYEIPINESYGSKTAGEYVHHSYRGGWCYLVPGKSNRILHNGCTADVNSLYPSMMSSESGNRYPVGAPTFWKGDYIPAEAKERDKFYFIRIRTRFQIKKGFLPFIQIKNSYSYRGNVSLETSDVWSEKEQRYYRYWRDETGAQHDTKVTLTLTMLDWDLLQKHYNLFDCEILDGCYFDTSKFLFDEYMEKYKRIKQESKGAKRELAKLFLNNLYGKMAASTDSSFKRAYLKPDGALGYIAIVAHDKKPGYIPIGSAITSYARCFTITAAQKNYHGPNAPGFVYADTDSIHCDLNPGQVVGITVHPTNFCCWKLESTWDVGIFVRQKTYIEHVIAEDEQPIEKPYYNVKCAGMPEKCKQLFMESVEGWKDTPEDTHTEEEKDFLRTKRNLTDFNIGLTVPGKLMPRNIPGGVLLTETTYEMRPI